MRTKLRRVSSLERIAHDVAATWEEWCQSRHY